MSIEVAPSELYVPESHWKAGLLATQEVLDHPAAHPYMRSLSESAPEVFEHSGRVAAMAGYMAAEAGCDDSTVERIRAMGGGHDVGKSVPWLRERARNSTDGWAPGDIVRFRDEHTAWGAWLIELSPGLPYRGALWIAAGYHHSDPASAPRGYRGALHVVEAADRLDAVFRKYVGKTEGDMPIGKKIAFVLKDGRPHRLDNVADVGGCRVPVRELVYSMLTAPAPQ